MPGTFTYGLYPFVWDPVLKQHRPADGAKCLLDLRPLPEQMKRGPSNGYGFVGFAGPAPPDLIYLGEGYAGVDPISSSGRNELKLKLNLSSAPAGTTIAEVMADVLGSLTDPTGTSMAKTIMPTSDGTLELHLEGHSRVWSKPLNVAELLSPNPKGHANKIRDVIRKDLDEAEKAGGKDLLQKALGAKLLSLGFSAEEIAKGATEKKVQIDRLMSDAVKAKHGADAKPRAPKTQLVETWPSDGVITSGQSQTWAMVALSAWTGGYSVSAGRITPTGSVAFWRMMPHVARCSSPISSADHWVDVVTYCSNSSGTGGAATRLSLLAETAYIFRYRYNLGHHIDKWIAGVKTQISAASGGNTSTSQTVRGRSNGSSQSLIGSVLSYSDTVTDTAITGTTYAGCCSWDESNNNEAVARLGAVTIDDGLGGGGGGSGRISRLNSLGVF